MSKVDKLRQTVAELQKKTTSPTAKMVGSHLLDIVGSNEEWAQIVLEDFAAGKKLEDLDKEVEQAAKRSGKRAVCGPLESTRAICKALGLPEPEDVGFLAGRSAPVPQPAASVAPAEQEVGDIDFLSLLEV